MSDIVNATILTADMKHAQQNVVLCIINEEWYVCVCSSICNCICFHHFNVTFQYTCNYIMLWYAHYMDQFCTCIFCVLYDSYSVNEFICILCMLVGCKLSEVGLKKFETCRSLSGLYVKVCISILVHFLHYLLIYIYTYIYTLVHFCNYLLIYILVHFLHYF